MTSVYVMTNFHYFERKMLINVNEIKLRWSDTQFSFVEFLLDELVVFLEGDGLGSVSSNSVDDFPDLFIIISVTELVANVFHVIEWKIVLVSHVQEFEVLVSSFLAEGVSLSKITLTSLWVSSLTKPSKSRGAPPVESLMSMINLKTISYFLSSPRVWAVWRRSLQSALLCLGSA